MTDVRICETTRSFIMSSFNVVRELEDISDRTSFMRASALPRSSLDRRVENSLNALLLE